MSAAEEKKKPVYSSREITEEMKESYLAYAMSVIIARALPDVRDGMKPVQRRILYGMQELGLAHPAKHKKSALIVGDVMGKYHPHGDSAIYDALARMAQDFSLRYMLVDGQGNFGSIDGDPPAAMRYTEARLTKMASELLKDIEKNTVPFTDNYDGSRKEPMVLPSRLPNLLLNGVAGIAVGMATTIPPHNLTEVIDATIHLIKHPKAAVNDLLAFVKGPDFPSGGVAYNQKDIVEAYATGKGSVVTRGIAEIVEEKGKYTILITEIPYQVNKATLVEKIASLVKEKKLEGIRDLRDESDKDGMRIVLELKNDSHPQKILNNLFNYTELQKTIHFNMLALVDGIQPQTLSLKQILEYFIEHRRVVVTRRTQYDLDRAKERAHILEGLKKALDHIDAIIKTIRASETKEAAHGALRKKFGLSDAQATAILEMKLQALAGLERKKIEEELKTKKKMIAEFTEILKDTKKVLGVIEKELLEIKATYTDARKTKIVKGAIGEFSEEDLIAQEETIITLTKDGYIKRINPQAYRAQKRGGKGILGMPTKEEDIVSIFLGCMTHDNLLFFTNKGRAFQIPVYEIPEASRTARGKPAVNVLSIAPGESITSILAMKEKLKGTNAGELEGKYLVMATTNGIIKRLDVAEIANVRKSGIQAIRLRKEDRLEWVEMTSGKDDVVLITKKGQSIRFGEKDVRTMGRSAGGVMGIRLKKDDLTVGMAIARSDKESGKKDLLVITENGFSKKTSLTSYKKQKRGGSGIKTMKITEKTGIITAARVLEDEEEIVVISQKGQVIRTGLSSVPSLSRATQGVRVMKLESGDKVASVALL
jgi:DNA gyrase subunit A